MRPGFEFLLGLLDAFDPAHVCRADFSGPHGEAIRLFQRSGFIAAEPSMNPVPSCPRWLAGAPYRIGTGPLCPLCRSEVEMEDLWLWRTDPEAFLGWAAPSVGLDGDGVERIDAGLWRLVSIRVGAVVSECFHARGTRFSERAVGRLAAFHAISTARGRGSQAAR